MLMNRRILLIWRIIMNIIELLGERVRMLLGIKNVQLFLVCTWNKIGMKSIFRKHCSSLKLSLKNLKVGFFSNCVYYFLISLQELAPSLVVVLTLSKTCKNF